MVTHSLNIHIVHIITLHGLICVNIQLTHDMYNMNMYRQHLKTRKINEFNECDTCVKLDILADFSLNQEEYSVLHAWMEQKLNLMPIIFSAFRYYRAI